jgi:hypothetical protein
VAVPVSAAEGFGYGLLTGALVLGLVLAIWYEVHR